MNKKQSDYKYSNVFNLASDKNRNSKDNYTSYFAFLKPLLIKFISELLTSQMNRVLFDIIDTWDIRL